MKLSIWYTQTINSVSHVSLSQHTICSQNRPTTQVFFNLRLLTSVFYCPVPGPTGNASAEGWTGRGLHQELSR